MIALTTPTGNIGSKVLTELLEAEAEGIRVLARDPAKLPATVRGKIEVVQGSMEDPAALQKLLDGAECLFWCQPDAVTATDYVGAYENLARIGAAAIRKAGNPALVAISATGDPEDTPAGPITALHRMERILAETSVPFRYLRCGSFFENLLWQWDRIVERGCFTYPIPGDVPGPQVAAADIARVAAAFLMEIDWAGRRVIPLLGPKDLTYDEMAVILSEGIGKPVRYEPAEPQAFITAMQSNGQSESAARSLVDMFQFLARADSTPDRDDRLLTQKTLAAWLKR